MSKDDDDLSPEQRAWQNEIKHNSKKVGKAKDKPISKHQGFKGSKKDNNKDPKKKGKW